MIPGVGPMELVIIGGITIFLFGAKRLPELGKSLGKGIREFQGAMKEIGRDVTEGDKAVTEKKTVDSVVG